MSSSEDSSGSDKSYQGMELLDWVAAFALLTKLKYLVEKDSIACPIPKLTGCYYLADAGYKLEAGYLTPYRETRFHKDDFVGVDMNKLTRDEKFNRIHSELRNIIERRFGVLKERWHILNKVPYFRREKQVQIIISCFAMDNYLWMRTHNVSPPYPVSPWVHANSGTVMLEVRDWIATMVWSVPLRNRRRRANEADVCAPVDCQDL